MYFYAFNLYFFNISTRKKPKGDQAISLKGNHKLLFSLLKKVYKHYTELRNQDSLSWEQKFKFYFCFKKIVWPDLRFFFTKQIASSSSLFIHTIISTYIHITCIALAHYHHNTEENSVKKRPWWYKHLQWICKTRWILWHATNSCFASCKLCEINEHFDDKYKMVTVLNTIC